MNSLQKNFKKYVDEKFEKSAYNRQVSLQSSLGLLISLFKNPKEINKQELLKSIAVCLSYLYTLDNPKFIVRGDNINYEKKEDEIIRQSLELINDCFKSSSDIKDWDNSYDYNFYIIHISLQLLCNLWGFNFNQILNNYENNS